MNKSKRQQKIEETYEMVTGQSYRATAKKAAAPCKKDPEVDGCECEQCSSYRSAMHAAGI